ncbi:LacI family DNA-binding transcriptional regulator [Actinoplanes sichuanensis]|uniref:LacI family DNA-binding transcriptional regulator n=1 Tax=Actinoplanes sichuanensis TaxID=512349 RepID=A0ABW4ASQ3_9ACTN|nr:LacI family DNA-binding transcriptional regulator [Actinoplanes sichuanensis]BEL05277.1 LacI family DNA-binding transcriptional regulator [Actinoplanes sichuanensis]
MKPVTISYIARTAGVSVPTVSKVVNGRSGVAAETRARVEALISQYGYRKAGSPQRTNLMELVVDEIEHMWGVEIIRGVQRVVREHRVGLVLTQFGPEPDSLRYWIDDTIARHPDCVVAVAQLSEKEQNQLHARGIPFVVLDPAVEFPENVPFVGATNWAGGRSATRHLIGLGHRDIAMISGPGHLFCQARVDGHRSALQSAGLPPGDVLPAPLTEEGGHTAARELLARPNPPTAVFTGNDLQAVGVYRAARELGLRIPADLSVVGFDDLPIAGMLEPALTTVHQPLTEMAVAATELALALGRGETVSQLGIELATRLVVRSSTTAHPPADLPVPGRPPAGPQP